MIQQFLIIQLSISSLRMMFVSAQKKEHSSIRHYLYGNDHLQNILSFIAWMIHTKKYKTEKSIYNECISLCVYTMVVTCFDDLPDLVLIELFSYLSSLDILWGFTDLNHRLTLLIIERNYFAYINLSLAGCDQFNRIFRFLPLNNIQSLVIDSNASPFQLTRWPYLPRLKILRIIGTYNYDDLLLFLLLHAATLTHLMIKSYERLIPVSIDNLFEHSEHNKELVLFRKMLKPCINGSNCKSTSDLCENNW
jgi:hypothetical protein